MTKIITTFIDLSFLDQKFLKHKTKFKNILPDLCENSFVFVFPNGEIWSSSQLAAVLQNFSRLHCLFKIFRLKTE